MACATKGRENTVAKRIAEMKRRVIEALEQTPVVRVACAKAGVGKDFYYEHRYQDPEFRSMTDAALREGRELMADVAESQLFKKVKDGDRTSIIFTLKNLRKDTYSDRLVHERTQDALTPEREREIVRVVKIFDGNVDSDYEEEDPNGSDEDEENEPNA